MKGETAELRLMGERVAKLLRAMYGRHRAKLIARDFSVSIASAERWLAGQAPTARHLAAMARRWPAEFIESVFPEALSARDGRKGVRAGEPGGCGSVLTRLRGMLMPAPFWPSDALMAHR